jgi:polar amino acid transport system substrate-binding protein
MRTRRLLWLVLVFALVAGACGDDEGTPDTTGTDDTTTTTEAPAESLTQVEGVLTVGSDIPYPPFEDFDGAGNVIGFDADLVEEMADRLGLTVEWIDTDFDTIFTQLATGTYDVVASATTITPERAQQVNFTAPYYKAQQALAVNTDLTPGLRSVDRFGTGLRVAVQTGTTGADWATENLAPLGVDVVEFPSAPDTYNALEAGQVDGVVNDEPSAVAEVANRDGLEIVDVIDTDENYGFGVDPARAELLAELDRVLQDMIDDGTYQTIYDAWFDAPAGSVTYEAPMAAPLTQTEGVLTVGSDIPYPPFEDFDGEGNVIGFDADLIEEMASRLGLTVEWIDTDFDTIFTQLATGAFDVVASATTITPERAQQVNFTMPYYKAQQALAANTVERPDLTSVDDLGAGDSVAVQTGTTGADWATENLAPLGVDVVEFPSAPDTYNALEAGQVDGVVNDEPSAVAEVGNRAGLAVIDVIDTNENYGFGVDPELAALLAELDRVLQDMIDDGTYQAIYDAWFDAPAGSVAFAG